MQKVATVGLDLAKSVFQIHAIDDEGVVITRRTLRRSQVLEYFQKLSPCLVALEACASAQYWARAIIALGHTVKMIPPIYVKAYVKRSKTDAADAEVTVRPSRGRPCALVPTKTADQQAAGMIRKREADTLASELE